MAVPKIFISSTCYDLKYIRENLKYFIKTLGYDPVLSEDGDVYFNPQMHTHDACLAEVPNCQIFVLIIGGRFGGKYKDKEHSITNAEFKEATRLKIPIFALVEANVFGDHHLYTANKNNKEIDYAKIRYPSVDSVKIFDFIDEVRSGSINNAIVSFRDYSEIETYLRLQWAGMLCGFLSQKSNEDRLLDTMAAFSEVNKRIEILSQQILESVGTEKAKIEVLLYNEMIDNEAVRDLSYWKIKPLPKFIIEHADFKGCAKASGVKVKIGRTGGDDEDGNYISSDFSLSRSRYSDNVESYKKLREVMMEILNNHGWSVEKYLRSE